MSGNISIVSQHGLLQNGSNLSHLVGKPHSHYIIEDRRSIASRETSRDDNL